MTKTQLVLLISGSDKLKQKIATGGPIVLCGTPSVVLSSPPKIAPETGRVACEKGLLKTSRRAQ